MRTSIASTALRAPYHTFSARGGQGSARHALPSQKRRQKALRVKTLRALRHCGLEPLRASKYCEQRLCAHLKALRALPCVRFSHSKGSLIGTAGETEPYVRADSAGKRALRVLKRRGQPLGATKHPSNYPRRHLSESSPEKRIGENPKRHFGGAGLIRTHRI